jgi:hypothetical protein
MLNVISLHPKRILAFEYIITSDNSTDGITKCTRTYAVIVHSSLTVMDD